MRNSNVFPTKRDRILFNASETALLFSREILQLGFDERFIRTWEYYFIYCAAGFKSRTLGNYQAIPPPPPLFCRLIIVDLARRVCLFA